MPVMYIAATVVGVLFVAYLLVENKTSRPDGTMVSVHPYRRIMWFIMPTRNESVVYWDLNVRAGKLIEYIDVAKQRFGAKQTHALVGALAIALDEHPKLNRFVAGKRLYQRNDKVVSFSMKRTAMDKDAKLAVVKQVCRGGMTFRDLCDEVNDKIGVNRSGSKTYADKEIGLFNRLPRPVFAVLFRLVHLADDFNLLPGFFIEGDPMYASLFVSNLGSLGMDPGYHHLYEWGNCPIFLMVGKVNDVPRRGEDGETEWVKEMVIRVSYDERVSDGLSAFRGIESIRRVLEDPFVELGCLEDDGSDARALTGRVG